MNTTHAAIRLSFRDPLGRETHFTFDEFGRQLTRSLPLEFGADGIENGVQTGREDFTEFFEYDERGRQVLHISFESVHTLSVYDAVTGRLAETRYFNSAIEYDAFINGSTESDDSEKREYRYDSHGRRSTVEHSRYENGAFTLERTESTTYTDLGHVDVVSSDEGVRDYDYDDLGRQTRVSFHGSDFNPTANNPFENVTEYGYDALGRLSSVIESERNDQAGSDETSYKYDLLGNLDQTQYSNGVVHDYDYDNLNRLDLLTHFLDSDGNGVFDEDEQSQDRLLADFAYHFDGDEGREARADGKRSGVTERFFDENGLIDQNEFSYFYDALGRLINEEFTTGSSDVEPYLDEFVYDIVGNRTQHIRNESVPVPTTTTTDYEYDANDRLQESTKTIFEDVEGGGGITNVELTEYAYDKTQQTERSVDVDGTITTTQTFDYNLQGRLEKVSTSTFDGTTLTNYTETSYEYDSSGNRVVSELGTSTDGNTTIDAMTRTEFLTDDQNHTGYSQVLKETQFEVNPDRTNGEVIKEIVYTVGHDQINQTVIEDDVTTIHSFGTDGHGSVRVLYELVGGVVDIANGGGNQQLFHFDAYGNLLNFEGDDTPITSYLYSGEAFDFNIGQQYLRARFYDPVTGRFNRLDPFYGNSEDPQSFHKYAYVHGDPIQGTDPSGLCWCVGGLGGFTGTIRARLAEAKLKTAVAYDALARIEIAVFTRLWQLEALLITAGALSLIHI